MGAAKPNSAPAGGLNAPSSQTASAPTASAAISGGILFTKRNANAMGNAIHGASRNASTRSMPKRRNTPATMAITIGIGTASIARRTRPETPSSAISTPVARKAPTTSGSDRWPSAGPTSTEPGMLHRNTSGWR